LNAEDGTLDHEFEIGEWGYPLVLSLDGRLAAMSRRLERTVQVWDTKTGRPVGMPLRGRVSTHPTAFSLDSRFLATMDEDGPVVVWEVATGLPVGPPLEHLTRPLFVAFSPDGRRLLSGSLDGAARVWDLSPDPRPVEELAAYARLLANRRLDDRGVLVPLTRDEEQQLWQRFRATAE
ncbi:MAG TPA: WD40 repeat domain-containing protein, partial [Gemmataceae bacterium]|nr:WD40 repeat domain-containing protein [Gemmataceae bacterium]